jgi:hypothetical protein
MKKRRRVIVVLELETDAALGILKDGVNDLVWWDPTSETSIVRASVMEKKRVQKPKPKGKR